MKKSVVLSLSLCLLLVSVVYAQRYEDDVLSPTHGERGFGHALTIVGDVMVVSANNNRRLSVYDHDGRGWVHRTTWPVLTTSPLLQGGVQYSASRGTIAVADPLAEAVYLYEPVGNGYRLNQTLSGFSGSRLTIAMAEDSLFVADPDSDSHGPNSGLVHIYTYGDPYWRESRVFVGSQGSRDNAYMGAPLAVHEGKALINAGGGHDNVYFLKQGRNGWFEYDILPIDLPDGLSGSSSRLSLNTQYLAAAPDGDPHRLSLYAWQGETYTYTASYTTSHSLQVGNLQLHARQPAVALGDYGLKELLVVGQGESGWSEYDRFDISGAIDSTHNPYGHALAWHGDTLVGGYYAGHDFEGVVLFYDNEGQGNFFAPQCHTRLSGSVHFGALQVEVLDSLPHTVNRWTEGAGQGFNNPTDMVRANGRIYLVDSHRNRVLTFLPDGTFRDTLVSLRQPKHIAADSSGNLYISYLPSTPIIEPRIAKYAPDGTLLTEWGGYGSDAGEFQNIGGLTVSGDSLYVTDISLHRVQQFKLDGSFTGMWGSLGSGAGQFAFPVGIDHDSAGYLYVVDSANFRIQKFDSNGNHLLSFGSRGSSLGQFEGAIQVAVAEGIVAVSDPVLHRITFFDSGGTPLSQWQDESLLLNPDAILILGDDIYVSDTQQEIVSHLQPACMRVTQFLENHPYASGTEGGSGTHTGRYWHIAVTGTISSNLTLPHSVSAPKVCRYTAGPGAGWACAVDTADSTSVTRNGVTAYSDWAVGERVGPTAVHIKETQAVTESAPLTVGGWLLALLLGGSVVVWKRSGK